VLSTSTIPPASRLLIRQGDVSDLAGVLRVCETHASHWAHWNGSIPRELRLHEFFDRALQSQDEVFQFWVAENGQGSMLGWEMLSAGSGDPMNRRLAADATTCLGQQSSGLGRALATHAIRHAARTSLQYVFARVPTHDTLMVSVLEAVGYQEVGLIPEAIRPPARPEQLEFVYVLEH
jgi:L-amino acid N-acyltransferase YncA